MSLEAITVKIRLQSDPLGFRFFFLILTIYLDTRWGWVSYHSNDSESWTWKGSYCAMWCLRDTEKEGGGEENSSLKKQWLDIMWTFGAL